MPMTGGNHQKPGRDRKNSSLEPAEATRPSPKLNFGLWVSRTVRK
jgi:hypothetical protein